MHELDIFTRPAGGLAFFCVMSERTFLIAGLGNPGSEYAGTRHNIGFDVVDLLCQKLEGNWEDKRYGWRSECRLKGRKIILLKPSTYMNLSGRAILYWMKEYKLEKEQLLVITDDINLHSGKLRLKSRGSDGGHNGLRNIQEMLMTTDYPRLRFGVGNDFPKGAQVHYVLGKWADEEKKLVEEQLIKAAEAAESFVLEGIDRAMNRFNNA